MEHQYALSTRTGAEALLHTLQAKTQADPQRIGLSLCPHLTVLSVDISAAYDTVSREDMLSALREVPQASALLPFVCLWYARESVYVWAAGSQTHRITRPYLPWRLHLPSATSMQTSAPTSRP